MSHSEPVSLIPYTYFRPLSISHHFHFFFFNDTATTEIYTLSLHDALPIFSTHYRVNTSQAIERLARLVGLETESIQLVPSRAEFMRFPPLAVIELLWIRLLQRERFRALRPNIIAVLRKRQARSSVGCLPSAGA